MNKPNCLIKVMKKKNKEKKENKEEPIKEKFDKVLKTLLNTPPESKKKKKNLQKK